MYWKRRIHIVLLCILCASSPALSKTFFETVRDLASFSIDEKILDDINLTIAGKISVSKIKFILPNKLELDDVEIADETGARMLYGKNVKLTISLISLLTNNIRITDAFVDSPFFRYTILKGGHNVINAFETPPTIRTQLVDETSRLRVTIEKVGVKDGNFEMFHDAGVEIFAEGIETKGKFWVEDGPFGVDIEQVNIAKGAIMTAGMDLPITDLVAKKLWISDEKVSTEDLTALYEQAKLSAQGTVFIDDDRYDIDAKLDAPKGTYPTGLTPLPFIAPAFRANVAMSGVLEEPAFATSIEFDDTDFNGLIINNGKSTAHIDPHRIVVESAMIFIGERGLVTGRGEVDIDDATFNFTTKQRAIFAQELATFLSFDQSTKGVISADTQFSGQYSGKSPHIRTVSKALVEGGEFRDLHLRTKTQVQVDIDYVFDKALLLNKIRASDDTGLSVRARGHGDLITRAVMIDYDLFFPNLADYYPLPKPIDRVLGLSGNGKASFKENKFALVGPVQIEVLESAKLTASALRTQMEFADDRLRMSDITASLYGGDLAAHVDINEFSTKQTLRGDASLRAVDVQALSKVFMRLDMGGKLSASLKIDGDVAAPLVGFTSEIDGAEIEKIELGLVQATGTANKDKLVLPRFSVLTRNGNLDGEDFSLQWGTQKLAGRIHVDDVNLGALFVHHAGRINGEVKGLIGIDGNLNAPIINANLVGRKISAFGMKMGDGPMQLALERRPLLGGVGARDLVFSVTTSLREQASSTSIRFAIALNHKTINTEVKVDELEVNTNELPFIVSDSVGIRANISGDILAEGPLAAPEFNTHLVAKEFGIFDPRQRDAQNIKVMQGPAVLNASSKAGKLMLDLCANFSEATGGTICADAGLNLSLSGAFNADNIVLTMRGRVDHAHLESVILPLKRELATLNAVLDFTGTISKEKNKPAHVSTQIALERLDASLPNIPIIKLDKPVRIHIVDDHIELKDEALLSFSPGNLSLRGAIAHNMLDIHLKGQIPLMASRFFLPIISRADGLAKGDIVVSGSLSQPIIEGLVVPEPRSLITFKKWLETMEFREGAVSFKKTGARSFITRFDDFKLGIGDGRMSVNGSFDKRYVREGEEEKSKFDLEVKGSNIVLRDKFDFVEADFNLRTMHKPKLGATVKGDITVTDGSAHRQFDLRNFVAQAREGVRGTTSRFLNALDMKLDLEIAIRQFRASLRMLNIDVETVLRAQLTAQGPIDHPKFKGNIVVTEGAIIFPATSFDLVESQIVLDENSDRSFDPKIDIVATQELSPSDYPQLGLEPTTVEFSLRGTLDRLNLGLRPIRGDLRLSQLKIFLLLLSPRSADFEQADQNDLIKRGAQNAAMAFSGEVFLRPLANELQDLLEGRTKTRIQFGTSLDAGGLSLRFTWKLSARMELLGSYAYFSEDARTREKEAYLGDSQYSLADLKLKLLLFDHRPAGPLSLETSFGSVRQSDRSEPRGKIRLKYRVLTR